MRIKLQHPRLPGVDNGFDGDRFYFEIQADGNHETLATSEIYNTHYDAVHAIHLITSDRQWSIVDLTVQPELPDDDGCPND